MGGFLLTLESAKNTLRMQKCPHFDCCSAVKCPLDELIASRVRLPEDREKCRLRRADRMRLGRDMKTKGLTRNEIAALVRTHGSLEKGLRAILNKNFSRKSKGIADARANPCTEKDGRKIKERLR